MLLEVTKATIKLHWQGDKWTIEDTLANEAYVHAHANAWMADNVEPVVQTLLSHAHADATFVTIPLHLFHWSLDALTSLS